MNDRPTAEWSLDSQFDVPRQRPGRRLQRLDPVLTPLRVQLCLDQQPHLHGAARSIRNVVDRVLAALLLLLFLPALLVIATLVSATSTGPVFFRQQRPGQHGTSFSIWKFRTMRVAGTQGLEVDAGATAPGSKDRDDPRITRVGRRLRATSLDELPQLINVLFGQMSLVGPRPLLQHEMTGISDSERRRHLVKPGMTGLWQVSGRSDLSWEERIRLDIHYVENWSPWLDVAILARTVGAVLRRTGAR